VEAEVLAALVAVASVEVALAEVGNLISICAF
jgi:hypothetical protein